MMKSNLKPRKQPLDAEYQLMEINWEDFIELDLLTSNLNPSPASPNSNQLKFFQLNQRRSEIVDQLTKNYVISHNLECPNKPMICLFKNLSTTSKGTSTAQTPLTPLQYISKIRELEQEQQYVAPKSTTPNQSTNSFPGTRLRQ